MDKSRLNKDSALLAKLNHVERIEFALFCAESTKVLYTKDNELNKRLQEVRNWLTLGVGELPAKLSPCGKTKEYYAISAFNSAVDTALESANSIGNALLAAFYSERAIGPNQEKLNQDFLKLATS